MEKGEFSPFLTMFSTVSKTDIITEVTFVLLSAIMIWIGLVQEFVIW